MCSSNKHPKHPLSKARKIQAIISLISWPCALAAIFTTYGSSTAQAWTECIALTISSTAPVFMLFRYRKSRTQSYSSIEVAIDCFAGLFFFAIWVSGIVINLVGRLEIHQVYSNLACLLLSMSYLRSFAKGFFRQCIQPMLKARRVNYTICSSCDRAVNAPMAQSQGTTVTTATDDGLLGVYNDDVESQPLLPEVSLGEEGKQTTGIVARD
ncbi:uncharacterized protein PGRI_050590 [Penicillium griseofulvum]|uniref:MARVEL domain-containing protein n=1 Tax=Penicillium patulum TaxID=5078 RepID=A0A135LB43_PENPA|nr:uncharacterized protein PGRI_050590 [Penicillium griseofulvum]KXG46203.1 hypothetical protein PGRI_050590 [Penicillium griseofulvum]